MLKLSLRKDKAETRKYSTNFFEERTEQPEEEEDEKEDEARDEDTMHAIQNISSKLLHSATTNEKEEEIELDELLQGFSPGSDRRDQVLLNLLTG